MKQTLLLVVLALGMYSLTVNAQTKKNVVRKTTTRTKPKAKPTPKDSREYQVGKDGFEWYTICKKGKYGAEDRNGTLLIPSEYEKIFYTDWLHIPGYFWVKTNRQGMGEGMYNRRGECIIPITRNYHFLSIQDWNREEIGAYFKYYKDSDKGNTGICNIKGEKVFEANCHYEDIKPYYKNGKFFYEVGIYDSEWRYGIIDGNGKIIVPIKYKSLLTSSVNEYFYIWDSDKKKEIIVGRFSDIGTNKNILADNIRLTASAISSFSNSSSSSRSSSSNSSSDNKTTTVVIEHHRDPVPVQEWVDCNICHGGRTCQAYGCTNGWNYGTRRACISCGGDGKCKYCNGNGGRYQTVYR